MVVKGDKADKEKVAAAAAILAVGTAATIAQAKEDDVNFSDDCHEDSESLDLPPPITPDKEPAHEDGES